jgi:hypothetical protein
MDIVQVDFRLEGVKRGASHEGRKTGSNRIGKGNYGSSSSFYLKSPLFYLHFFFLLLFLHLDICSRLNSFFVDY